VSGLFRVLELFVVTFAAHFHPAFRLQSFDNVCAFHVVYYYTTTNGRQVYSHSPATPNDSPVTGALPLTIFQSAERFIKYKNTC